ncbi:MAG: hypothetical protein V2A73_19570, partial [Pseudomonadota bacterium]
MTYWNSPKSGFVRTAVWLFSSSALGIFGCSDSDETITPDTAQKTEKADAAVFDGTTGGNPARTDATPTGPSTIDAVPIDGAPPAWFAAATRLREKVL